MQGPPNWQGCSCSEGASCLQLPAAWKSCDVVSRLAACRSTSSSAAPTSTSARWMGRATRRSPWRGTRLATAPLPTLRPTAMCVSLLLTPEALLLAGRDRVPSQLPKGPAHLHAAVPGAHTSDRGRRGVCDAVAVYINDTALPEGDRSDAWQTTGSSSVAA